MSFFYHNLSSQEEQQYVAKFLKILESLEETASSYLFQKGVFLGDDNFLDYEQRVNDEKHRESIIKTLLRPGDKSELGEETFIQIAMLLLKLCREASQFFLDINSKLQQQSGVRGGIIALGYHLALIDRTSAFLNLPSVNDKSFWRLLTVTTNSTPLPESPQKTQQPNKNHTPTPILPPMSAQLTPNHSATNPVTHPISNSPEISPSTTAKENASSPNHNAVKRMTEIEKNPARSSQHPKTAETNKSALTQHSRSGRPDLSSAGPSTAYIPFGVDTAAVEQSEKSVPPVLQTAKLSPAKKPKKSQPKIAKIESAKNPKQHSDSNKTEGPIQAMLRRIVKEINNDSYDAVINALKDAALMTNLYKSSDDPISVKVIEVDTNERVVHLIKQRMGQVEPVTFRLIRKLLAEL